MRARLTLQEATSKQSLTWLWTGPFPVHQTSFSDIASITQRSPEHGTLRAGKGIELLSVEISATGSALHPISLQEFVVATSRTTNVTTTNWILRDEESGATLPCTENSETRIVSCSALSSAMGRIMAGSSRTFSLLADVSIAGNSPMHTLSLRFEPGSPNAAGGIGWTDAAGTFRWVDVPALSGVTRE